MNVKIFERLKDERKRLQFKTQQGLAETLEVSPGSVHNYESGKRLPDAGYLAKLAEIGADVQYIVTGQRSAGVLSPDEMELLETYRHIPIDKRSVFRTVGVTLADTRQVKR